jgi:hypothetical protein
VYVCVQVVDRVLLFDILAIIFVVLALIVTYLVVHRPILYHLDTQTSQCRSVAAAATAPRSHT